jgi:ribonuclease Z
MYGGQGALQRVQYLMNVVLRGVEVDMDIELVPVRPGPIWQNDQMRISCFPVSHRGPGCFGYIFEEHSRRPFLSERAEALGVPRGPERRQLVQGQTVTLADGRVVYPEDVLGEEIPGIKVVQVGDAGRTDNLVEACRGADALVVEATYTSAEADMAARFGHLTAAQAAELAVAAGVKHLFLVHLSRRYSEWDVGREARAIFEHTIVPRDLDQYRITREGVEKVEDGDTSGGR